MDIGVFTSCPHVTQFDLLTPYPITPRIVPVLPYEPTEQDWKDLEYFSWLGPAFYSKYRPIYSTLTVPC